MSNIEPLSFENQIFAVTREIELCPSSMMIRELVQNGIEASARDPSEEGEVIIDTIPVKYHPEQKLRIFNNGPGMDAEELRAATNLSSSRNKTMALDGNFGIGAKVASLKANKLGMRYRSCRMGRVSQVVLYHDGYTYGRLIFDINNIKETVVDVTEICKSEGYDTSKEFTEVVLYGNEKHQNTGIDPYNTGNTEKQWLPKDMYHRFYRLPPNVKIKLAASVTARGVDRYFVPWADRHDKFNHVETVETVDGIKIHYYDDPKRDGGSHNMSSNGALCSSRTIIAIVYKNEMYDVREGSKWTNISPIFGVPFGAKYISIIIELPDNYIVQPESYRDALRYKLGDERRVAVEDFQEIVRNNMPQHFIDLVAQHAPQSTSTEELEKELQDLLNASKLRRQSLRITKVGDKVVTKGMGDGSGGGGGGGGDPGPNPGPKKPAKIEFDLEGAHRAIISSNLDKAPRIHRLHSEEEIVERGLVNRAGQFFEQTNELFVNMTYSSVVNAQNDFLAVYAAEQDTELMRQFVKDAAEDITVKKVGRAVIFGKLKRLENKWTQEDMHKAMSPECLSIAADDWGDLFPIYKAKLSKKFKPSRLENEDPLVAA